MPHLLQAKPKATLILLFQIAHRLNVIFPFSIHKFLHDFVFFMFTCTKGRKLIKMNCDSPHHHQQQPARDSQPTTAFPRMFCTISRVCPSLHHYPQLLLTSQRTHNTSPHCPYGPFLFHSKRCTSCSWSTPSPVLTALETEKQKKVTLELPAMSLHRVDTNLISLLCSYGYKNFKLFHRKKYLPLNRINAISMSISDQIIGQDEKWHIWHICTATVLEDNKTRF